MVHEPQQQLSHHHQYHALAGTIWHLLLDIMYRMYTGLMHGTCTMPMACCVTTTGRALPPHIADLTLYIGRCFSSAKIWFASLSCAQQVGVAQASP